MIKIFGTLRNWINPHKRPNVYGFPVDHFPLGRKVAISDNSRLHGNLPKKQIDLSKSMSDSPYFGQLKLVFG